MTDRFVVLGVAGPRAEWFTAVGQWSHAGSIPLDFVKCVSAEQARVRLRSGRLHSAVLVDGALATVDRDLLASIHHAGAAALVVDAVERHPEWIALGADAALASDFGPSQLVDTLRAHAALVPTVAVDVLRNDDGAGPTAPGRLAMLCGAGGTGASTLAIAFAQQWCASAVLADLSRNAEQAVLHDAGDVGPGIEELAQLCRTAAPDDEQVRAHTYAVTERGYALLLGLRKAAAWTALRPRAVGTALDSLGRTFGMVVVDCDADFEGQADGGSLEVEERNAMARAAAARADVVFAVGTAGVKGVFSLARVINDIVAAGVPPRRIVPVLNRVSRGPRARAKLAAALAALLPDAVAHHVPSPLFVPDRDRDVERALHDRTPLPAGLGQPLVDAYAALSSAGERVAPEPARRVVPGDIGAWREDVTA